MLKLDFSKQALDFLRSIPAKHGKQIAEKLNTLCTSPELLQTEALQGFHPFRRLKSGEYRVVYFIESGSVFVLLVGKRNDDEIYKLAKRLWRQ
jgi:mRNA interferase RelE/StbE